MTPFPDHPRGLRRAGLPFALLAGVLGTSTGCSPGDGPGTGEDRRDAAHADLEDAGSDRGEAGSPTPEGDGGAPDRWDAGAAGADASLPPLPDDLGPGLRWVRAHPMFISGLIPSMGAPSPEAADAYFDDFGANAVHLWQRGLPTAMDGWRAARPGARFVSWVREDGTSLTNLDVLGGYGADVEGRIGYQVGDEPRNMADLLAIEEGVRAVRERDPNALVIVNFGVADDGAGPGGGGMLDAMLQYTVENDLADVISHDNYSPGRSGHEGLARRILDHGGGDVDRTDTSKWSALHLAARHGHEGLVALLLEHGADTDVRLNYGWSVLHIAAEQDSPGVCERLMAAGAEPDVRLRNGWTPLHIAARDDHPLFGAHFAAGADYLEHLQGAGSGARGIPTTGPAGGDARLDPPYRGPATDL